MPLFDRFETWKTWVGSPHDLAQVMQRALEEVKTLGDAEAHARVDMFFPNHNIRRASLDDFVALRPPELAEVERIEIKILPAAGGVDPRLTLTLRKRKTEPALTLSTLHTDRTFVEGMTTRLKRDLDQIAVRRGSLVEGTWLAIVFTVWTLTAVALYYLFTTSEKPTHPFPAVMLGLAGGYMAALFVGRPIAKRLVPDLPTLELVPIAGRDRYQAFKRSAVTMLSVITALWTIVAGVWAGVNGFLSG